MKISYSDFAGICFKYPQIKGSCRKYEFPNHLSTLFMREPYGETEENLDNKNKYFPCGDFGDEKKQSLYRKYVTGKADFPASAAGQILGHFDAARFADAVSDICESPEAESLLRSEFEQFGVVFGDSNTGETLIEVFKKILSDIHKKATAIPTHQMIDSKGCRLEEVNPDSIMFDKTKKKLIICKNSISIDPILWSDDLKPEEQIYVEAVLEAYADYQNKPSMSIDEVKGDDLLSEDFSSQRNYFFAAESVHRGVRDAFENGEEEFCILKEEAYEGIREEYLCEYKDGYQRMNSVLKKSTSTDLSKSKISSCTNLIGNKEKKGICHILVNERRIKTWVMKK